MMRANVLANAVFLMALDAPRLVRVLCVYCANEEDPKWEHPARSVPGCMGAECERCGVQNSREGMLFLSVPMPSTLQGLAIQQGA